MAFGIASQPTVAFALSMFEEAKFVGISQLVKVVNDVELLNELDPAEQTVWTWNWYAVPAVSPVKLLDVVVIPVTVIHEDDDEAFHWRL